MNKEKFTQWLLSEKKMTERSARDVICRCNRISKLFDNASIDSIPISKFIKSDEFGTLTFYIKSQLKRALSLYIEFKESK